MFLTRLNQRQDFYDKNHYMLKVEDNADGMDEATQENLFPFLIGSIRLNAFQPQ